MSGNLELRRFNHLELGESTRLGWSPQPKVVALKNYRTSSPKMHTKFSLNTYSKLSNQVHLKKSDKLYPTPDLFAFLLGKNCWKKGCCQAWVNSSNKNHPFFSVPWNFRRQFLGGFREPLPKNHRKEYLQFIRMIFWVQLPTMATHVSRFLHVFLGYHSHNF